MLLANGMKINTEIRRKSRKTRYRVTPREESLKRLFGKGLKRVELEYLIPTAHRCLPLFVLFLTRMIYCVCLFASQLLPLRSRVEGDTFYAATAVSGRLRQCSRLLRGSRRQNIINCLFIMGEILKRHGRSLLQLGN